MLLADRIRRTFSGTARSIPGARGVLQARSKGWRAPTSSSRPAATIRASWGTTGSAARFSSAPLFAWPSPNHPPLRDDHAATGRPTQRLRNPPDGRSTQRSKRRRLRLGNQWRNHPPRRHCRAGLSWDWPAALAAASLLEAALQHVAALPRDQTPARLAFSRSRAPARPGRPRRRQPGGTPWRNGCRRENAGRAPCEPSGNGSTGSAD